MMYVDGPEEIRQFIVDGVSEARAGSATATEERRLAEVRMPAYGDRLSEGEVDDLVAAFLVLSGMARPPGESAARRGEEIARRWHCFSCHGAGGSGGLPNPGSLTGFVPGWYGADFEDLVRGRAELDEWVTRGTLGRLEANVVAARFMAGQRLQMPAYDELTDEELADLWAYVEWLGETSGGLSLFDR